MDSAEYYYSDKTLLMFQLVIVIILALFLVTLWSNNFSIADNLAVTITNGVTTSTSVMIAGSGILLNYSHTSKILSLKTAERNVRLMVAFMFFSGIFIFWSYSKLITGEYTTALKLAMSGLSFSLMNFLAFAVIFYGKLLKKH
jgi:hypothetical protein